MDVSREMGRVLMEEAERQKISPRAVGIRAGHKNALYKLAHPKDGNPATITLETLWALARALGVTVSDLAYRVEKRLETRASAEDQAAMDIIRCAAAALCGHREG